MPRASTPRSRVGGGSTGWKYFPQGYADRLAPRNPRSGLIDGVPPVIIEAVAVQERTSRQAEPPGDAVRRRRRMRGFGQSAPGGRTVTLGELYSNEVYLNQKAADKLDARPGTSSRCSRATGRCAATVKAIVRYDGVGTMRGGADAALVRRSSSSASRGS